MHNYSAGSNKAPYPEFNPKWLTPGEQPPNYSFPPAWSSVASFRQSFQIFGSANLIMIFPCQNMSPRLYHVPRIPEMKLQGFIQFSL